MTSPHDMGSAISAPSDSNYSLDQGSPSNNLSLPQGVGASFETAQIKTESGRNGETSRDSNDISTENESQVKTENQAHPTKENLIHPPQFIVTGEGEETESDENTETEPEDETAERRLEGNLGITSHSAASTSFQPVANSGFSTETDDGKQLKKDHTTGPSLTAFASVDFETESEDADYDPDATASEVEEGLYDGDTESESFDTDNNKHPAALSDSTVPNSGRSSFSAPPPAFASELIAQVDGESTDSDTDQSPLPPTFAFELERQRERREARDSKRETRNRSTTSSSWFSAIGNMFVSAAAGASASLFPNLQRSGDASQEEGSNDTHAGTTSGRITGVVYDARLLNHINIFDEHHPECPDRIHMAFQAVKDAGLLERCKRVRGQPATDEQLLLAHSRNHLNYILSSIDQDEAALRTISAEHDFDVYFSPETGRCGKLSCGSVISLCEAVWRNEVRNGIAIVRGFCVFNNVAVAARHMQKKHGVGKILIVDWDIHHGNGTQEEFYEDPNVIYFSIHRFDNGAFYPHSQAANYTYVGKGDAEGRNINIPWPCKGMGDSEYIHVFQKVLMPIAQQFDPDLVIVSAGFDAARGDELGQCDVTPECYAHMTHMLMELANGKVVLALEGGYNLKSVADSVAACTSTLLGNPVPRLLSEISDVRPSALKAREEERNQHSRDYDDDDATLSETDSIDNDPETETDMEMVESAQPGGTNGRAAAEETETDSDVPAPMRGNQNGGESASATGPSGSGRNSKSKSRYRKIRRQPRRECVEVVRKVLEVQSRYWSGLGEPVFASKSEAILDEYRHQKMSKEFGLIRALLEPHEPAAIALAGASKGPTLRSTASRRKRPTPPVMVSGDGSDVGGSSSEAGGSSGGGGGGALYGESEEKILPLLVREDRLSQFAGSIYI
ncbi:hypothetical protein HK102_000288, partial [Quaeritorhiza haematococci]